jgi:hypothetical protein
MSPIRGTFQIDDLLNLSIRLFESIGLSRVFSTNMRLAQDSYRSVSAIDGISLK